jgi:hypothetical protein
MSQGQKMKITKRQLRNIVKEEIAHPRDSLETSAADVEFPIVVGYEGKSEIAYDQDELDDIIDDIAPQGIKYSLDSLEDMEPSDRPVGATIEQFGEAMKITKRQLRRIIKEEKQKLLSEQGGWDVDPGNHLVSFAKAWAGLGGAVQEQVVAILVAWNDGAHDPDWKEAVYEQNPNAIDMAQQRLGPFLRELGEEGEILWDALEEAQKIYEQGEAEVEADARAAGDR